MQCRRATEAGIAEPRWGAITVIQRFGSAAQLLPHAHTLGMDGVFAVGAKGRSVSFHDLGPPTDDDLQEIADDLVRRVAKSLERSGLLPPADEADPLPDAERSVSACYGAAIQGRLPFCDEAGNRTPPPPNPPDNKRPGRLQAASGGFNLHAGVALPAGDRESLERLCRYIARPPIANDRLERLPDGRLLLRLKRAFSDGSTHILLTPQALIQRLCALIPRPRTHRVRYHGLLAPASPFRRLVVPQTLPAGPPPSPADRETDPLPDRPIPARKQLRWILWAELLRRVLSIDPLKCPRCSGRMRVVSAIFKADAVAAILESLGFSSGPPTLRSPRPPPGSQLIEYEFS